MSKRQDRYDRQSFLGPNSSEIIKRTTIAVLGAGGGGSHVVQQLNHIGFKRPIVYDKDFVEDTNLNRMIGATEKDAENGTPKIEVMERISRSLHKDSLIKTFGCRWQENPAPLRLADIIVGCVDGFREREEIEIFSRRYLIPYVDIGMDVHAMPGSPPKIAGQVILSMPGYACMKCMYFLTPENLAKEAGRYGDAGSNPQVVWPNGVLASTVVGVVVDLLTDWSQFERGPVFLSYDGNRKTLTPDNRMAYVKPTGCPHYSGSDIGDPRVPWIK
jgi:molybdopterin/thiamine biosynthesis adenylyltransferase